MCHITYKMGVLKYSTFLCVAIFCTIKIQILLDQVIKSFDMMLFYIDPLQPVKESAFVCELFDWDKYLSCSWRIGTYKRESNIDVAVVAETE